MIVNITMEVTLKLPDGSSSMDGSNGRGWVLPNGDWVKPFVVLEMNDDRDLTYLDALKMGMDVSDFVVSAEIGE